ncbi:E3 ubiquitin/ISG15 ligase TRIM25-like [Mytilus trossulus]|uniref:E3 ubiquitin/ISG15 ligase TRIM25-like n=1 Tax=Mytilus trossulus TaxID=6551 RepID=UPI003007962B
MASTSSYPVPCGPCTKEKVNNKAGIWCYNCNEGLCSTCSGHHKKFGSTRDHKTIDIQTYKSCKPSIGAIKTKCDAHDQQFNLYCPSHLLPCCDECVSTHHSKCTGIKSLTSVVEKTKIKQNKASVEKHINSILLFLNTTADKKTKNIKKGEQQYKSIKESISKLRKEINKHLDQLEKKIYKEADTVWSEEKAKLTGFITEIEEKKKSLKEIQGDLHIVKVHASKLQSFLGVHQIEQVVHQCQRYVEDIEKMKYEISCEVDIKIEQNDEIEIILREIKSLKSFGEVKVVKSKLTINRETSVSRDAQGESISISNKLVK